MALGQGEIAEFQGSTNVDISEVYSFPRVAKIAAERRGLSTGTSFDITTVDENGIPWDLSKPDVQERCMARVKKEKPGLLIGSPMCRDWSQIMNINWPRMSQEERDKRMKEARMHLRFVCILYILQDGEGRYLVHEHPQGAGSWNEDVIEYTRDYTGAEILTVDQCQYGLMSTTPEGEVLPALKPTKIMTNCKGMRTTLYKRCDRKWHRHARLEGGKRTSAAQKYPDELCGAFIHGYIAHKK